MAISLEKGQRVTLTKVNSIDSSFKVCLGWDEAKNNSTSFLGRLFGSKTEIDIDASVILLDHSDKVLDKVFFGKLKSDCKGLIHSGDNLTGAGDGDNEIIDINLNKVSKRVKKMIFVTNIYNCLNRKQDFGMVDNAFIRTLDKSGKEILRYNLTDLYSGKTAVYVAEIYQKNNEWKFNAIGKGSNAVSIDDMVKNYR